MIPRPGTIAFLGFGEAARAFRETLAAADPALQFLAYDIKLTGPDAPAMQTAIRDAGAQIAPDAQALGTADWIFSSVTADQSLAAVEPMLPGLSAGRLVLDINSVSPGRKRTTAARIQATGADYLDMAVMSPVRPRGHASPVLIAGQPAGAAVAELDRLGFSHRFAGDAPGAATAIKMVRSLFVKGLEAITVETLLAAQASGCRDEVLASLTTSYPGLNLPDLAPYNFERTLTHGTRRAAEMRESAATLDDLGLTGGLAAQIAEVQAAQGLAGEEAALRDDLAETLAAVLAARQGRA